MEIWKKMRGLHPITVDSVDRGNQRLMGRTEIWPKPPQSKERGDFCYTYSEIPQGFFFFLKKLHEKSPRILAQIFPIFKLRMETTPFNRKKNTHMHRNIYQHQQKGQESHKRLLLELHGCNPSRSKNHHNSSKPPEIIFLYRHRNASPRPNQKWKELQTGPELENSHKNSQTNHPNHPIQNSR